MTITETAKTKCPTCGTEGKPVKGEHGWYSCPNPMCNRVVFECHQTRTQHINEVNALRSQNKLK